MKDLSTIVDDIYELFDKGHESSSENLTTLGNNIAALLQIRLRHAASDGKPTLRMSNVGKPCERALYYDIKGYDREPLLPHTKIKFLFGDIIEELLLFLAKEAGHAVSDEQAAVKLNGITGHIDAIIDGAVVDVKSASPFAFKKFKDGTLPSDDPFGYISQISGYKEALDVDRAAFLAMDKVNGTLALYEPPEEAMMDVGPRIDHLKDVMKGEEPPERSFSPVPEGKSGNTKLPMTCSYCAHKKTCFPSLRTFIYSGGRPVYLVDVVKEPRVMEVT